MLSAAVYKLVKDLAARTSFKSVATSQPEINEGLDLDTESPDGLEWLKGPDPDLRPDKDLSAEAKVALLSRFFIPK